MEKLQGGPTGARRSLARLHIDRLARPAIGRHGKDGDFAAAVVGNEYKPAGEMHAAMRRSLAARADAVELGQLAARWIDGNRR